MNFDPIHWAAVALGIALVGTGVFATVQTNRLDNVSTQYELYKGATNSQAERNKAIAEAEISRLVLRNNNLDKEYIDAKSNLDIAYANYDRLRKQSESDRSRSNHLEAITRELAGNKEAESRLPDAMGKLEDGILQELAKPRDEVILLLNQCLDFISDGK